MTAIEPDFGYPTSCIRCQAFSSCQIALQVQPFYKAGTGHRIMLIGQDPTIFKNPERVKRVLMLDQPNSQLRRWLQTILGPENFNNSTIYATNLVKCSFDEPPSLKPEGGWKFLRPYFDNCKEYLTQELTCFQPHIVLALGEPAHKLLTTILENTSSLPREMQAAFTGTFYRVHVGNVTFDYSPCLHIKTFRVAETYGDSVNKFKQQIIDYFSQE